MNILPDFLKIQNKKRISLPRITINSHVHLRLPQCYATVTERKGWWKLDNTNSLTSPVNGYDKASLTLVGSHVAVGGDEEEGDDFVLIGVETTMRLIIQLPRMEWNSL